MFFKNNKEVRTEELMTRSRYTSVALKIGASIFGIVGLGMGALQLLLEAFALGGMDLSYFNLVATFVVLAAEILALVALIMLWWRPRIAVRLFIQASLFFLGSLVFFCVVFAHVSGLDLLVALFTTPHNVYVLPSWLPLLFAGLLTWSSLIEGRVKSIKKRRDERFQDE